MSLHRHRKSKSVRFLISKRKKSTDDINNTRSDLLQLQEQKENELWQDLEQLKNELHEKNQTIDDLELNVHYAKEKTAVYKSKIAALEQYNQCLRDDFNEVISEHKDTQQSLLNAKDEIIYLKKALHVYLPQDTMINTENVKHNEIMVLHETPNDNEIKKMMQQMEAKFSNELKDMNHKYRRVSTNYFDIQNRHVNLQNQLTSSRTVITDLQDQICDLEYELEQNIDFKQSVDEMLASREMFDQFDSDENEVEITCIPDFDSKSKKNLRRRSKTLSLSQFSQQPMVFNRSRNMILSGDLHDFASGDDIFADRSYCELIEGVDQDLFVEINDCLCEIYECVQKVQSFSTEQEEKTKEVEDMDKRHEPHAETLLNVFNTNQEGKLLLQIQDIVKRCKDCITEISEIHKQQMVMMMDERKRYEMNAVRNMKRLTKDVYEVQYKKYRGYKQICWEMVGNVSMYTKDAIVYRLTH